MDVATVRSPHWLWMVVLMPQIRTYLNERVELQRSETDCGDALQTAKWPTRNYALL